MWCKWYAELQGLLHTKMVWSPRIRSFQICSLFFKYIFLILFIFIVIITLLHMEKEDVWISDSTTQSRTIFFNWPNATNIYMIQINGITGKSYAALIQEFFVVLPEGASKFLTWWNIAERVPKVSDFLDRGILSIYWVLLDRLEACLKFETVLFLKINLTSFFRHLFQIVC